MIPTFLSTNAKPEAKEEQVHIPDETAKFQFKVLREGGGVGKAMGEEVEEREGGN